MRYSYSYNSYGNSSYNIKRCPERDNRGTNHKKRIQRCKN